MDRETLCAIVKSEVGEKRYPHVCGTEQTCRQMAHHFSLDEKTTEELATAALLHDITKHFSKEEHLAYLRDHHIDYDEHFEIGEKTLHELTGAYYAREKFPDLVTDTVFCAIRYHTTGRPAMTLTEKLLYLADFIEPTRTFDDCVQLRKMYYDRMSGGGDPLAVLDEILLLSFDMTLDELRGMGAPIHPETLAARQYLLDRKAEMSADEKGKNAMEILKEPKALAEKVIAILDARKAKNIKLLYTEEKTILADYFVICSGNSNTQTRGLADEIEYQLSLAGITPARVEGRDSASWILMDYSSVLVHVFNEETRHFYHLEKLWNEATEIDISHLLKED